MKSHRIDEWSKNGVTVGSEVDVDRIADDAVLHPGCRIRGAETSIGPGLGVATPYWTILWSPMRSARRPPRSKNSQ